MEKLCVYLYGDVKVEIEEVQYNGEPNYCIVVTGHRSKTRSEVYVPIPKEDNEE